MDSNSNYKVSVIIPVYNAEKFVQEAVQSALIQPETDEVLIIEDGSTDKSLGVCRYLADKYEKVQLYQHPGGINKGAPASFNLGIEQSKCEYVAFLGADDYFLPGRFSGAMAIFSSDPFCEGVYDAIGKEYEDIQSKTRWINSDMSTSDLTTMTKEIPPEDLFEALLSTNYGYFSLDGLVIKKESLEKVGYMDEKLFLHQDMDYIYRLAFTSKLKAGRLNEPVTIRRIHQNNRISANRTEAEKYRLDMKQKMHTYRWLKRKLNRQQKQIVFTRLFKVCRGSKHLDVKTPGFVPWRILMKARLLLWAFEYPEIVLEALYWKNLFALE